MTFDEWDKAHPPTLPFNLIVTLTMHGDPHSKPDMELHEALGEVIRGCRRDTFETLLGGHRQAAHLSDATYSSWLHEIGCCFPGECCMAHTDHFRHECYTPEMAESEDCEYPEHNLLASKLRGIGAIVAWAQRSPNMRDCGTAIDRICAILDEPVFFDEDENEPEVCGKELDHGYSCAMPPGHTEPCGAVQSQVGEQAVTQDTNALLERLEFLCSEYDAGRWRRFTETRETLKQSFDTVRSQIREIERLTEKLDATKDLMHRWFNAADTPDAHLEYPDMVYRRLTERRHAEELRQIIGDQS